MSFSRVECLHVRIITSVLSAGFRGEKPIVAFVLLVFNGTEISDCVAESMNRPLTLGRRPLVVSTVDLTGPRLCAVNQLIYIRTIS